MTKVTARNQVTIPAKIRREMGIGPGTEVEIAREGQKYVLVVNPVEALKKKWVGRFKGRSTTMEYMDEVRGKVN